LDSPAYDTEECDKDCPPDIVHADEAHFILSATTTFEKQDLHRDTMIDCSVIIVILGG
jgi:hypothetical protein